LNLSLGRFSLPSQGAVDNGAACAILLGLADRVQQGDLVLERTRLTLAIFTGEEVNMQGSRAYASERNWPLPTIAVNLEVMAQDGSYVYWEQDGTSLKLVPTSMQINQVLAETVADVTGVKAMPAGPVNSDGYSFLRVGVPATTLGTYDTKWVDRGFHSPADNLGRVVMARLPEAVEILARLITKFDSGLIQFPGNSQ
jgi:putative aminopeptidase FrvX